MLERLKVYLWILLRGRKITQRYMRETKEYRQGLELYDSQETVRHLQETDASICRYGDGELQMVRHYLDTRDGAEKGFDVDTFQSYNPELAERLYQILVGEHDPARLVVGLPYTFKDSSGYSSEYGRIFFEREFLGILEYSELKEAVAKYPFYDAAFTRFYLGRRDIKDYPKYVESLKSIWQGKDILFVEGEKSRLGVGNDLFDSARSVRRILAPSTNAFSSYSAILDAVMAECDRQASDLILLALGHTATVLAYDLSQRGQRALDVGHIDIEYEWYRMKAKGKVAVPGKYVNEVKEGREVADPVDAKYQSEIVARVR